VFSLGLIIHTKKILNRQGFGANIDGNPGAAQEFRELLLCSTWKNSAQIVDQLFAARGKYALNEVGESGEVCDAGFPVEADDGGVDLGPWHEGAGWDGESPGGLRIVLHEYGQRTVLSCARLGADAFSDFLLKHHGDFDNACAIGNEDTKQRGGDVVGQVADDVIRTVDVLIEIDVERIGIDDFDIGRHVAAQRRDQVAIDLDADDALRNGGEFARKRTGPRTDLDDGV